MLSLTSSVTFKCFLIGIHFTYDEILCKILCLHFDEFHRTAYTCVRATEQDTYHSHHLLKFSNSQYPLECGAPIGNTSSDFINIDHLCLFLKQNHSVCMLFCVWFLWSIILRFTHAYYQYLWLILITAQYSITQAYSSLFIYSPVGDLGCLQFLAIMNNAVINNF